MSKHDCSKIKYMWKPHHTRLLMLRLNIQTKSFTARPTPTFFSEVPNKSFQFPFPFPFAQTKKVNQTPRKKIERPKSKWKTKTITATTTTTATRTASTIDQCPTPSHNLVRWTPFTLPSVHLSDPTNPSLLRKNPPPKLW